MKVLVRLLFLASAIASSPQSVMKQFNSGCSRSARASTARVTSSGEISLQLIRRRRSAAERKQGSSLIYKSQFASRRRLRFWLDRRTLSASRKRLTMASALRHCFLVKCRTGDGIQPDQFRPPQQARPMRDEHRHVQNVSKNGQHWPHRDPIRPPGRRFKSFRFPPTTQAQRWPASSGIAASSGRRAGT